MPRHSIPTLTEALAQYIPILDDTVCWEWLGHCNKSRGGYGTIVHKRRAYRAHRAVWIDLHGEIPDGMYVCHQCDNPPCVNPKHLFLGTAEDNARDRNAKGRHAFNLPRAAFGENASNRKLSAKQVDDIRHLHASGRFPSRRLSKLFGVGKTQILRITNGQSWTHTMPSAAASI